MRRIELPDHLPLAFQDIQIMRCTTCGAIVPGVWQINKKTMRAGIDHVLDEHRADLVAGRLQPPLFVNCGIQDPFWFEEQTGHAKEDTS